MTTGLAGEGAEDGDPEGLASGDRGAQVAFENSVMCLRTSANVLSADSGFGAGFWGFLTSEARVFPSPLSETAAWDFLVEGAGCG